VETENTDDDDDDEPTPAPATPPPPPPESTAPLSIAKRFPVVKDPRKVYLPKGKDIGRLAPSGEELKYQARLNRLFQAGLVEFTDVPEYLKETPQ